MNVEESESIVRDELRRDAANAPSGRQLRATVLDAVADVPMTERAGRRWALPLLVAAAVVALAIAATLLPRAFGKHSQPAKPSPAPSLPAPPSSWHLACAKDQQQVTGAGTRYSIAGGVRYAYEYYCAAPDGSRTGSEIDTFQMIDGQLEFDQGLLARGVQQYVMSMTGTDGGLLIREYDASLGIEGQPGGLISDVRLQIDAGGLYTGVGHPVAQPCLATDLMVEVRSANEPTIHEVLRLTNHSGKACAVWGNPRYSWADKAHAGTARSVVRGPAGGLAAGQLAAPPLLLQPGETASAAIAADSQGPADFNCPLSPLSATLANGVRLGTLDWNTCHLVSYPLVRAGNGSVDHPESEAPPLATSGSCGTATTATNEFELSTGSIRTLPGGRIGTALIVSAHGGSTCTIGGLPNVRALDAGGNLLAIAHQQPLPGLPTGQVTVSPGHPASALVDWTSGSCYPDGHTLQLALGGDGYGFGQSLGRFCDLRVHQFVSGSTGSG